MAEVRIFKDDSDQLKPEDVQAFKVELMALEIIDFLKKEDYWETDTGMTYNGRYISHKGGKPDDREMKGVLHMWFEGPLNHALNYGEYDPQGKIYKGLVAIMEKYGYYPEFDTHCDWNVYPI